MGDSEDKSDGSPSTGSNGGVDQETQNEPPQPVGFWDPRLKAVRREAFTKWTFTTFILMTFLILVLSIYWDFDGQPPYDAGPYQPMVGPTITSLAQQQLASPQGHLGYEFPPLSQFGSDPIEVRRAVYDWDAWAAIIISSNATAMLHSAISAGNASYDPLGACQLVYQSARDNTLWFDFINPSLRPFLTLATSTVGEQWAKTVLQNATGNNAVVASAAQAPQALNPAIGFSEYDLRPFYPYTAVPAVSIGLIYLIIVSFFSFSFYLPIHFKYLKPEGHPPLKFWQLTIWRWFSAIAAYFMLSLAYSLVSAAFQINFYGDNPVSSHVEPTVTSGNYKNPSAYGNGTFPIYWMLNFFGMIALGLACENMAMIVGQPWTGCWLIFWVITNVVTAFYDIGIEPGFYKWGYAWPLHYVVQGSRQVIFDLHGTLGLDFGVLIAWGAVNTAVFPFACYFMRWKSKHHVNEYYR